MSQRKQLVRGAALVGGLQFAGRAFLFVRNLILARMLGPDNMGVAAIFVVTLSFIELSSDLSVTKLIIQSPQGARPSFLRTGQTFELARGLLMSLVLFALAWPAALLFDEPQILWALQLLAVAPFIRAFMHLDFAQQQRRLNYLPTMLIDALPIVITTLLAYPLALWLHDWRAYLAVLMCQPLAAVATSRVVARRPWRVGWNKRYARGFLKFGWPLLLNGVLLFWVMQGDRVLLGAYVDMAVLGLFFVAANLGTLPSLTIASFGGVLFLAPLSACRDDVEKFRKQATLVLQGYCAIAVLVATPFVLFGQIVPLLYGEKFLPAQAFVGWLAIAGALRLIRAGTTLIALSRGDSQTSMFATIARLTGLALAFVALWQGYGIMLVIYAAVVGEVVALAVATWRLKKVHRLRLREICGPMALALLLMVGPALVVVNFGYWPQQTLAALGAAAGVWGVIALALYRLLPGMRYELHQTVNMLRRPRK